MRTKKLLKRTIIKNNKWIGTIVLNLEKLPNNVCRQSGKTKIKFHFLTTTIVSIKMRKRVK